MAIRKFLTSVADVYGYSTTDTLLFTGKTLLDSSIEVSLGSSPVRGGRGNQLQYIYYHTGEMKFALTDTQWNLAMLGASVGSTVATGNEEYVEESVEATVNGNTVTATVAATPLAWRGIVQIKGWAITPMGNTIAGTFSGKNWTGTKAASDTLVSTDKICIRFYALDAASTSVTVSANMIPAVVKLVMEAQLNSADVTTNKIGMVQILVPTATLSGAFTISMKSDGVANTPLTASALAYVGAPGSDACQDEPYYAKIIEVIDTANWYDNVIALSVVGGDYSMGTGVTSTLNVWAIPSTGSAFKVDLGTDELTFAAVGPTTSGTVGANTGIITSTTTAGTLVVNAMITDSTAIDTTVIVTVA